MLICGKQTFTIGRGNEIVCAAIEHLAARIQGRTLESLVENWGKTWRHLVRLPPIPSTTSPPAQRTPRFRGPPGGPRYTLPT